MWHFGGFTLTVSGLPLHLASVDLGSDMQRHGIVGQLGVGLLHGTDQPGAGGVGSQVFLKGLQIVFGEADGAGIHGVGPAGLGCVAPLVCVVR